MKRNFVRLVPTILGYCKNGTSFREADTHESTFLRTYYMYTTNVPRNVARAAARVTWGIVQNVSHPNEIEISSGLPNLSLPFNFEGESGGGGGGWPCWSLCANNFCNSEEERERERERSPGV